MFNAANNTANDVISKLVCLLCNSNSVDYEDIDMLFDPVK